MALIDEGKLQSNIIQILDLLKKEAVCCPLVSGQWMCNDGTLVVWVTMNANGGVRAYDAPGGVELSPIGTLTPVNSDGVCP